MFSWKPIIRVYTISFNVCPNQTFSQALEKMLVKIWNQIALNGMAPNVIILLQWQLCYTPTKDAFCCMCPVLKTDLHYSLQGVYDNKYHKLTNMYVYVIFKYLYSIYYDILYLWEVVLSSSLS